jgi:heme/copper-type cytochrome/quinol oxidase subunit 2
MKMGLRKAWLWTKLVLIFLVIFWLAFFFAFNSKEENATTVWLFFFGAEVRALVSLLVFVTAVIAVVGFFLAKKIVGVFQQLRKLREEEHAEQRARDIDARVREVEQKLSSSQAPPAAESGKDTCSGQ